MRDILLSINEMLLLNAIFSHHKSLSLSASREGREYYRFTLNENDNMISIYRVDKDFLCLIDYIHEGENNINNINNNQLIIKRDEYYGSDFQSIEISLNDPKSIIFNFGNSLIKKYDLIPSENFQIDNFNKKVDSIFGISDLYEFKLLYALNGLNDISIKFNNKKELISLNLENTVINGPSYLFFDDIRNILYIEFKSTFFKNLIKIKLNLLKNSILLNIKGKEYLSPIYLDEEINSTKLITLPKMEVIGGNAKDFYKHLLDNDYVFKKLEDDYFYFINNKGDIRMVSTKE